MSTRVSLYLYLVWGFEPEEVEIKMMDGIWMVERRGGLV
jgi:hypothetical protein